LHLIRKIYHFTQIIKINLTKAISFTYDCCQIRKTYRKITIRNAYGPDCIRFTYNKFYLCFA
jgi:hypothetical protein